MLLHLGRPRLLSPVGSEATSQREQTETQTQQPQPVTQPNSILEFLKRLVSGSATTTTADSLEASHGKHKHLPLKESHSTTVGKHDVQMRTREFYATRSPPTCSSAQLSSAQLSRLSYTVRFLSLPVLSVKYCVCRHTSECLFPCSCHKYKQTGKVTVIPLNTVK